MMDNLMNGENGMTASIMNPVSRLPIIKPKRIRAIVKPFVDNLLPDYRANNCHQKERYDKLCGNLECPGHKAQMLYGDSNLNLEHRRIKV
jgi:hypothetical protein